MIVAALAEKNELGERVRDQVRVILADPKKALPPQTEVYKDLRISGDDLWDLIVAIHDEFGTDFTEMDVGQFAPGEADWGWPWPLPGRKWKSLTVGDLERAVIDGHWKKSG